MKTPIADKIMNKVIYGDERGFGYSHPTGKEQFEQLNKEETHDCKLADKGFCDCVNSNE
jgi:hypothetical protein